MPSTHTFVCVAPGHVWKLDGRVPYSDAIEEVRKYTQATLDHARAELDALAAGEWQVTCSRGDKRLDVPGAPAAVSSAVPGEPTEGGARDA